MKNALNVADWLERFCGLLTATDKKELSKIYVISLTFFRWQECGERAEVD